MPEFYIIIARNIFFPNFTGHVSPRLLCLWEVESQPKLYTYNLIDIKYCKIGRIYSDSHGVEYRDGAAGVGSERRPRESRERWNGQ